MLKKVLRKAIGSAINFKYIGTEYTLNPNGTINEKLVEFSCHQSHTTIRRLEEHGNFEALVDNVWTRITEDQFLHQINIHKSSRVRRRGTETKKKTHKDVLDMTRHSDERLYERINISSNSYSLIMEHIFQNAVVIPRRHMPSYLQENKGDDYIIYEKDLDICMIAVLEHGKFVILTVYPLENKGKFYRWFKDQKASYFTKVNRFNVDQPISKGA